MVALFSSLRIKIKQATCQRNYVLGGFSVTSYCCHGNSLEYSAEKSYNQNKKHQRYTTTRSGPRHPGSYRDDGFAEAQRAPAAVLPLVLRLVITQSVVLQHDPAILPAVDVVCPLWMEEKRTGNNFFTTRYNIQPLQLQNKRLRLLSQGGKGHSCTLWELREFSPLIT